MARRALRSPDETGHSRARVHLPTLPHLAAQAGPGEAPRRIVPPLGTPFALAAEWMKEAKGMRGANAHATWSSEIAGHGDPAYNKEAPSARMAVHAPLRSAGLDKRPSLVPVLLRGDAFFAAMRRLRPPAACRWTSAPRGGRLVTMIPAGSLWEAARCATASARPDSARPYAPRGDASADAPRPMMTDARSRRGTCTANA